MKLFYRNKILITGMFPMKNFKVDGYTQKSGLYNENIIDLKNEDNVFYVAGHLMHSVYACVGKDGNFYEYFENEQLFEYEIDDKVSKKEIEKIFIEEQYKRIKVLQKKLRLITGLGITLPVFKTSIYDNNDNLYTIVGNIEWETTSLTVKDYTEEMKRKLEHRLAINISDSSIIDLEEKNSRFKRALNFYLESFNSFDIGVRVTLLFSSLESMFNITAQNISKEISKYASKILFLSSNKSKNSRYKINTYYDIRSKYIHGNDGFEITRKIEDSLREYIREILIIYWNISTVYKITDAQKIKDLLDRIDRKTLDLQVQVFIRYLRTDPSKYKELYEKIRSNFINENYQVLTNQELDIK